jgi:hypothetical protein
VQLSYPRCPAVQPPSLGVRHIKGLLDPCTNSKLRPNIPAEVCYDINDNGLKLSNSWAGYHVLLNPDFKSQVGAAELGGCPSAQQCSAVDEQPGGTCCALA